MIGFRRHSDRPLVERENDSQDIAKLFFDKFSKRLSASEDSIQKLAAEVDRAKSSIDQSRVSDLVLFDRLQKAEQLIRESLVMIRESLDEALALIRESPTRQAAASHRVEAVVPQRLVQPRPIIASHILSPTGELGSLQSITTPTELQVLNLLASEGAKSAPEIGVAVGRSREHTARLMKKLFEEGYIRRDQTRIPFRYSVVEKIRLANSTEVKDGEREEASIPQS